MKEKDEIKNINNEHIGGIIYGNVGNANTLAAEHKYSTPRGHGFIAENANHLYDKISNIDVLNKKVILEGENKDPNTGRIIKNGADRVVNGIKIQTKYCSTGSKCISECFDKNGQYRYNGMQIEVPSDQYEAAVSAMKQKIKDGKIPGVKDVNEAEKIVRKGHFTYEQVKNIAKAGTVESITYDVANGAIVAANSFGVSALISFATSVWNGESINVAMKNATYVGLKTSGTTFITAVLVGQLSKTSMNSALVGTSKAIVNKMSPKAQQLLVNAFKKGPKIYGAAATNSAAKMLRGNMITGMASIVVLSSVDIVNIFRGRISGKQLFKSIATTTASVAGGTAGWVGGATVGASVGSFIPVIGTVVGGFVGGLIGSCAGGTVSSKVANTVLSNFIEDDAEEMVRIIEKEFSDLAEVYLLSKQEAERIVDKLKNVITGKVLKDMYASSDRNVYAYSLILPYIEREVINRKKINVPSDEIMQIALSEVFNELAEKHDCENSCENYEKRIEGSPEEKLSGGENYSDKESLSNGYEELSEHMHRYEMQITKYPTCKEDGISKFTCECGESYTEVIPKTGHTYNQEFIYKEATCTEPGIKKHICACGEFYTESIPLKSHNYVNSICTGCGICDTYRQNNVYCREGLTWDNKRYKYNEFRKIVYEYSTKKERMEIYKRIIFLDDPNLNSYMKKIKKRVDFFWDEEFVALYDDTIIRNMAYGMLITNKRIINLCTKVYVYISDITEIIPERKYRISIRTNDFELSPSCTGSDLDREILSDCLNELLELGNNQYQNVQKCCKNCGHKLKDNYKFCVKCGKSVLS